MSLCDDGGLARGMSPELSMANGELGSSFKQLLCALEERHLQELAQLRSENDRLLEENVSLRKSDNEPFPSLQFQASLQLPVLPPETVPAPGSFDEMDARVPTEEANNAVPPPPLTQPEEAKSSQPGGMRLTSMSKLSESEGQVDRTPRTPLERFARTLEGDSYELIIGCLILSSVLIMAAEFQYNGYVTGHAMGYKNMDVVPALVWPHADDVFWYTNIVFTVIFVIDVVLRISVLQLRFWMVPLNWLDFVVVVGGLVELIMADLLPFKSVFLRMLRLVKLARALRVIRFTRILESLHLLLKCIRSSVTVLFWSLCLLGIIQCIAGMIISQVVKPYLDDPFLDADERKAVFRYYGTFTMTVLTMFEVLFANWAPACRILVDNVSDWFILVFIIYRCLVGFAILNVVNAVFIQQTMKVAQADQELVIAQKQKAAENYAIKLKKLFHQLDSSGDGHLSWDEFSVMLSDPKLKHWMGSLELESHDLVNLFHMIDDGDGQISVDEFMNGAGRLKGPAKSVDVANVLAITKRMDHRLESLLQGHKDLKSPR